MSYAVRSLPAGADVVERGRPGSGPRTAGATKRHMCWSQPNPWANSIGWPSGAPVTGDVVPTDDSTHAGYPSPSPSEVACIRCRAWPGTSGTNPLSAGALMRLRNAVAVVSTLALGAGAVLATAPAASAAQGNRSWPRSSPRTATGSTRRPATSTSPPRPCSRSSMPSRARRSPC